MAAIIGALRFVLGADTAAFERGLNQAQSRLKAFGASAARAGAVVGAAFVGIVAATAVNIQRIINQMDQMLKASQSIGIPIEQLSGLRHAADLSGVAFESLTTSMSRLSRSMQESLTTPTSTAARTFDALGISVRNVATGGFRPTIEVMEALAERFARMEDGAGKTALAMNIFGRAGAQMIPLLNLGRDGLRQAADEAARLGLVFNEQTARGAEAFNDNIRRLKLATDGLFAAIATGLVPTLEALSERMFGIVSNGNQVKAIVDSISATFRFLINVIATLQFVFTSLAREIMTIGQALREGVLPGTAEWNRRMAAMTAETNRAREALRQFGLELQRAGEGFRGVAGKIGEAVPRTAAPILITSTAIAEAQRRMKDEARAALDDIIALPWNTYEAKLAAIRQALEQNIITQRQYGQMVRRVEEENRNNILSTASLLASTLTTVFAGNKAAAIAAAIINTAVGITRALQLPPPFSWIQAGLIAASGAAQIASIKSTNLGGGGSTPTVSGTASSGETAQAQPSQMLTISGLNPGDLFSGESMRNLAEKLISFQKDGGTILIK